MNHLAGQKSPYLIQHASNPVDWYPWGEEAFARARSQDRPVFLSIGYSTCHWCHVMETESFEDAEVAALMNEVFVSIKVDREERPDLDERFMEACMRMSGSGGWPLSLLLTPQARPFYAATYIPRDNLYGRVGMLELVPRIARLWTTRREEVLDSASSIEAELDAAAPGAEAGFAPSHEDLSLAVENLARGFDAERGGFGSAPKFPMPSLHLFLLRSWRRRGEAGSLAMVEKSLHAMRDGGIYDQLGGGFHRYSTDAQWQVPHFEKMLYDQALELLAYTEAWQATGEGFYRDTALEIAGYVLRDLGLPAGGFASAEDADSEGVEGRFYMWSRAELAQVLGEEGLAAFARDYDFDEGVLSRIPGHSAAPGEAESLLLAARAGRERPLLDDKLLTDWNGLMIAALARAGAAFGDRALVETAARAAGFIWERMRDGEGRLLHRFRGGEAAIGAFADDHAFLAWGLLELYEASLDTVHLERCLSLMRDFTARFWDEDGGGYYMSDGLDALSPARRKSLTDGVIPSANSVAILVLARLARMTGDSAYEARARAIVALYPGEAIAQPLAFGFFLAALDFLLGPSTEIVIAGVPGAEDTGTLLAELGRRFLPEAVLILRPSDEAKPAIAGIAPYCAPMTALGGRATVYVCRDFACSLPTASIETALTLIQGQRSG